MTFYATGLYTENFTWPNMNVHSHVFRNAFIGQLPFALSSLKSVDGCYDPLRMTRTVKNFQYGIWLLQTVTQLPFIAALYATEFTSLSSCELS